MPTCTDGNLRRNKRIFLIMWFIVTILIILHLTVVLPVIADFNDNNIRVIDIFFFYS